MFLRKNIASILMVIGIVLSAADNSIAQQNSKGIITDKTELAKLKAAVEKTPEDFNVHSEYISAMGKENPKLEKEFQKLMEKHPKSAKVAYAIGRAYIDKSADKSKPYMLKAVAIDPKNAAAWSALAYCAITLGDEGEQKACLKKAVNAAPDSAKYAYDYARSFSKSDKKIYEKLTFEFLDKFPESEEASSALYWLAIDSDNLEDKINLFERLKKEYAVDKHYWSLMGMKSYINVLIASNPEKAIELAKEMKAKDKEGNWDSNLKIAQIFVEAKKMINQKNGAAALAAFDGLKLSSSDDLSKHANLLKAQATALAANTSAAYNFLIVEFVKSPTVLLKDELFVYGKKMAKEEAEVKADIWKQIDLKAKPATPFTLKNYFTNTNTSLSDYKGKVVLLTYWYLFCSPCRAEFPHFENVVQKFKGQDLAYLGLNTVSKGETSIVSFVKKSGYSFIPLQDTKPRDKGNVNNGHFAPVNFLIDKEGRVVFSRFRTEGDNEADLELMINLLMEGRKA